LCPTMVAFVWTEIGFEAGESPEHVLLRKEAERIAGAGEFGGLLTPRWELPLK
jgi:hypothetical protein